MTDHSWAELEKQQEKTLVELFASDPDRVAKMTIEQSGLRFDVSKTHLDDAMLSQFAKLAEDMHLGDAKSALFSGAAINITEGRAAEHAAERGNGDVQAVAHDRALKERMRGLVEAIDAGFMCDIKHILHIGIGGSALGPKLLVDALGRDGARYDVKVVSNIDGAALTEMAAAAAHLGTHAEHAMPLDRTRRQPPALQAASVVRQQSTDSLNISGASSAEWDDVLFRGQVPSFVERSARSYPVPKSSILADDDSRGMPEEVFGRVVDQHGVRSKPKPKPLPSPTKAPVTDRDMYGETMREYGLDIEDLKTARKAAAKAALEARETANLNRGSSIDDRGGKGERIAVAAAMADLGLSLDEIRNAMRHRGTSTLEDEPEDLLRKAVTWDEEVARAKKWALRGAQTNWARFD